MAARNSKYVIGIDEVGRECLAGPVVVAACALPLKLKFKNLKFKVPLRDSKKLTAKQREEWFKHIKNHPGIFYAKASVYPKVIDRINITQAANKAATRACARVIELISHGLRPIVNEFHKKIRIYLDGGLYLQNSSTNQLIHSSTVIRGDEKFNAVKLASIVAKVSRDRVMRRNHKKYPEYGFIKHVGYGTKTHIRAIKKHGPSKIHRLTFLKNFVRV